ncbi:hypothetical protein MJO28_004030 [Puccinia striiformis f. sp. tritici]|uniref:Uncharacterized protein n=3 Tax=Puccinia striiformis TaxID=27350 RepID=A0A0L0VQ43_9BASI|nr:hypothetical protein Pst134EB_008484 [Puccinia striiformis f. sp. tritici]KAI9616995.1 hypothetical protein H4Q26_010632 [Puccinia striiformis f. sp. tritici PST-130]KNF01332.1 hypothetical protein PSTG_05431 [Puccinia striiformis f. sp. tritici PST-78]POV98142.1 hypothetical protein PSTT_14601 [Puccinia striiformis]KAI7956935.1 hypothetical protein MJO28_004030 [Puccinia striiformis f. sp. tritici]
MPAGLSHVGDSLIAAGLSSDTEVTNETVLDLLDSQLSSSTQVASSVATPSAPRYPKSGGASALLTQKCPQGCHLPSANHTAKKCFSLHQNLLTSYHNYMKAKTEAEAHLAKSESLTMFNVEVVNKASNSVNDLVSSLNNLPANLSSQDKDNNESELGLI